MSGWVKKTKKKSLVKNKEKTHSLKRVLEKGKVGEGGVEKVKVTERMEKLKIIFGAKEKGLVENL